MKYSFIFFGVSMTLAGSMLIYDISKPKYDEDGNVVEDEFSHMPFIFQLYNRVKKEFSYYKKVKNK